MATKTKQPTTEEQALDYIRTLYRVPAYKDVRVAYEGKQGTIRGAKSGRLLIALDVDNIVRPYHPTYHMEYHPSC